MFAKYLCVAAVILTTFAAVPAFSSPFCGERQKIVDGLAENFNEYPAGYGIEYSNVDGVKIPMRIVEIFLSNTGSFTILTSNMKTGMTCLLTSGGDFKIKDIPADDEPT